MCSVLDAFGRSHRDAGGRTADLEATLEAHTVQVVSPVVGLVT
jgi:hypothetical protein